MIINLKKISFLPYFVLFDPTFLEIIHAVVNGLISSCISYESLTYVL